MPEPRQTSEGKPRNFFRILEAHLCRQLTICHPSTVRALGVWPGPLGFDAGGLEAVNTKSCQSLSAEALIGQYSRLSAFPSQSYIDYDRLEVRRNQDFVHPFFPRVARNIRDGTRAFQCSLMSQGTSLPKHPLFLVF